MVGSESRVLSKLLRYNLINKNKKIHSFEHGARSFLFKADYNSFKENRLKFTTSYYLTEKGVDRLKYLSGIIQEDYRRDLRAA